MASVISQKNKELDVTSTLQSKMFQLYSGQTGSLFGKIQAVDESDAVDQFARKQGFSDRRAMWNAGRFEYVSAHVCAVQS